MTASLQHIGVLTSGGDAPGMNAAIRAVVRACVHYGIKVSGIQAGYQGLIDNHFDIMDARSVAHIINKGGTILKSARCMQFHEKSGRQQAYNNTIKAGMDALVVIGGDGSFTGARIFSEEYPIPVIGVPGTIDNDIYGTDFTIGYDTALNNVVEAIDKIRDTATSHNRLFFIECMGRDSGFIALNAGIAGGACEILVPEDNKSVVQLVASLRNSGETGKTSSIVLVAEGDQSGGVFKIARETEEALSDYNVRVSVLGHIQRGGIPTCADRVLGSRLGVAAVEKLMAGENRVMVGVRDQKTVTVSFSDAISRKPGIDKDLLRISEIVSM